MLISQQIYEWDFVCKRYRWFSINLWRFLPFLFNDLYFIDFFSRMPKNRMIMYTLNQLTYVVELEAFHTIKWNRRLNKILWPICANQFVCVEISKFICRSCSNFIRLDCVFNIGFMITDKTAELIYAPLVLFKSLGKCLLRVYFSFLIMKFRFIVWYFTV